MSSNFNESSLIVINSKDRINQTSSTSNFSVDIGSSIGTQSFSVKSVSLTNIQYNVNTYNNTLSLLVGTTPFIVSIPVGQYTTPLLLLALKTAIDTDTTTTVIFEQSSLTQKIGATFTSESTILAGGLAKILGFTRTTEAGTSLTADGVPNLQGTYNYYIQTGANVGSTTNLSDQSKTMILTEVPNNVSFGNQIIYEPNDFLYGKQRFANYRDLKELRFTIVDDNMDIVDLQGTDVVIVLKLFTNA